MQQLLQKSQMPQELMERKHWVLWKLQEAIDRKTGKKKVDGETGEIKTTKIPYQINGKKAKSSNPETWASYDSVLRTYKSSNIFDGIGYVVSHDDPFTAIDLDDCIIDGEITPEALGIVKSMDSYTEYSQSGNGLHIFIKGKKPGSGCKNPKKGVEIYDNDRFIAMTGNHVEGTPTEINEQQDALNYIYDSYFPEDNEPLGKVKTNLKESPKMEDQKILSIAFNARNGQRFQELYKGNWESSYSSQSEADLTLCNMIAFYTQDPEQIERIFAGSGLYRGKWDRQDYKARTIQKAITDLKATFQKSSPAEDFQAPIKDSPDMDLKKELERKRFEELASMWEEWEANGGKGRKPNTISPFRCSEILSEYISFVIFDSEENTRLAMYLPNEGIYTRNTTIIKRVISWLEPKLNSSKADDAIYYLTNRADVKEKTQSRYLIPVKNGVFNLKTKGLEPFSPEYVFTTKISTDYIPNAPRPEIDGWNVDSWLESIACGDREVVNLLWQVISDSLNGNYSRRKAIFLIGSGNNGKGTFQELITNLIGLKNIATLKVNEFDERFKLSVLEGKTAVIGDDVPANVYIDDSSNFNSVVTGDMVSVEFKNKPIYNTFFRCTVIQSTNDMPKFKNKTNGTLRRLIIVPFKADFNGTKEDFKIKDEYIKDEKVLQYVLYKAINLDFEKFDVPAASKKELEVFQQDNDPVLDFKLSVFDEWQIQKVPKYVVYGFYKEFCEKNSYRPLSDRQFHKQFKGHLGSEWDADAQGKYNYESLMKSLGDLDCMRIGFPDKGKNYKSYENTKFKAL